jgi:hypothetical protein
LLIISEMVHHTCVARNTLLHLRLLDMYQQTCCMYMIGIGST